MQTRQLVLIGGVVLMTAWLASAQQTYSGPIRYGTSAGVCSYIGELWIDTSSAPTLKTCTVMSPATWVAVGGGGSSVPTGAILFVEAGTCPSGFAETSTLDGKTLVGTLAASGNVGTTGGSDAVTPAGTNAAPTLTMTSYTPAGTVAAPVFTGSAGTVPAHTISWPAGVPTHSGTTATFAGNALGTHAHELPLQIVSATSHRLLAAAIFGTGTSRAAASAAAADTANATAAVVALSQAVSAGTPAGTVTVTSQGTIAWPAAVPTMTTAAFTPAGTNSVPAFSGTPATLTGSVSAPTFTGASLDNRSAFTRVIFCKKT